MSILRHIINRVDTMNNAWRKYSNDLLLLLAAPTWLWGRCGIHNSPPASSVIDFIFRRSNGTHVSVDTVRPSLLRSSSFSSRMWYHLSRVFLPTYSWSRLSMWPNHICLSVSPRCHRFSHGLFVCGRMPICTSSFLSLSVSSHGS